MGRTIPLIKKTTGIQNLDFKQYLNYRMPLPSPSEQRRIIEILDQADALRKQRNEADKIAEKILPALFNKMFGSVSSENIMTIQKLLDQDYLIVHKDGNFGSMYPRESDFGNEGVLFVTAKNVDELGFVDFQDSPRLNQEKADSLPFGWIDNGDVVLAHNATVGRVGIIENATERMLIGTSLTCFRTDPHKLDPYYLLGALRSNQFQNQLFAVMKQGTRNQVPITAQRRFSIANPRIEDQIKFGSQIRTLRSVFMNKQSVRVNIDRLFSTLLYQAFSGDLTAKWREAHMKELLQELEEQARELNLT
jgi:type I restriction enzyme S subunit